VESKDQKIIGKTRNVSLGGALITQANGAPPEGALVTATFQAEGRQIRLKGRITSKVIHTRWEVIKDGGIGSFGVKFEESTEQVREKLRPVQRTSISREKYLTKALKNYVAKHSEQVFALLILISVATINYLIPYKLVFLNFFFIFILIGAYYLGLHKALMGAVLTTLIVVVYVYYFPGTFMPTLTGLDLWMNVLTWSSFLILTGALVGQLIQRLKTEMEEANTAKRQLEIYSRELEEWLNVLMKME
jgi:K+-sensing histidine kinase KdpD